MPLLRTLVAAVAVAATAQAALAQSELPAAVFPPSLKGPALETWLRENTTLKPGSIIAVGGGRVVAEVSRIAISPTKQRLTIRTELVDAEAAQRAKALSETNAIDIDCAARLAKVGETLQYADRNLVGTMQIKPAWTDWTAAAPGTTMDQMISRACERPLRGSEPVAAAKAPARSVLPAVIDKPVPQALKAAAAPPASPRNPFTSLVQISASTSPAQAQASLEAAKLRHGDLLGDHPTSVDPSDVGGQTYYRALIGGFDNAASAAAFCASFKAAGGECLLRQR